MMYVIVYFYDDLLTYDMIHNSVEQNFRFVDENGNRSSNLLDVKTRHIVPVELNSYLCRNARILSEFYTILGNSGE